MSRGQLTKEVVANHRLDTVRSNEEITLYLGAVLERSLYSPVLKSNVAREAFGVEQPTVGWQVIDEGFLEVVSVECNERTWKQ